MKPPLLHPSSARKRGSAWLRDAIHRTTLAMRKEASPDGRERLAKNLRVMSAVLAERAGSPSATPPHTPVAGAGGQEEEVPTKTDTKDAVKGRVAGMAERAIRGASETRKQRELHDAQIDRLVAYLAAEGESGPRVKAAAEVTESTPNQVRHSVWLAGLMPGTKAQPTPARRDEVRREAAKRMGRRWSVVAKNAAMRVQKKPE
jgi:hypothetical protein